ncbi:unnamed protein product [Ectocarpus sp. 13 AM-2016]
MLKPIAKILEGVVAGTIALTLSTVSNAILLAVVLARFVIMSILRTTSTFVEFAGETVINSTSFIVETVFSILTFVVQTVTNSLLFLLNQLVSIWRVVVTIITTLLGESCFLTKTVFRRMVDAFKDLILSIKAFGEGFKGLAPVMKAQTTDFQSGVGVKAVIKQSVASFKQSATYIVLGDEGSLTDGLLPNVFFELFKVLPLSFDLGKVILVGTLGVAKEAMSSSASILRELVSLKGISLGCSGKTS